MMIDESWYQRPQNVKESLSVGGIIVRPTPKGLQIALVRDEPYPAYFLPKGGVKHLETFEAAARREILEEAGLQELILIKEIGVQERLNFDKTSWKIIHYFLFITYQESGTPTDPKHRYVCEWFPLDELPDMFWPEQRALLEEKRDEICQLTENFLADQEKLRHYQREEQQERQLFEVTRTISSALDLGTILHNILHLSIELVSADAGALGLVIPNTRRMTSPYLFSAEEKITTLRALPRGEELAWLVIELGEPMLVRLCEHFDQPEILRLNGSLIELSDQALQGLRALHICGLIGVPITAGEEPLGALLLYSYSASSAFDIRALNIVDVVGRQAGVAIKNARLYEEIQELAIVDPLTGAYNRRYLFDLGVRELERMRRYRHPIAVIMFDIDHFKKVNDTYGHAVGDIVLQQISSTAQNLLRQSDTLCRYGGEEFVVLMPETTCESAAKVAERMRQAFAGLRFQSEGEVFQITVSFGVSSLNYHEQELQNGLESFEGLLEAADQALYKSKNSGRNCVSVF